MNLQSPPDPRHIIPYDYRHTMTSVTLATIYRELYRLPTLDSEQRQRLNNIGKILRDRGFKNLHQ